MSQPEASAHQGLCTASDSALTASEPPEALAHLYGEPLYELPDDLYIPPDALELFLESFEGPLDLLLYLIRKQNFDVLDVPMALLTEQYLAYVEQIRAHNLSLAGEYLVMAAVLIEIKSRLLLPVKRVADDDEVVDPRAELVRRLLEYEQIKRGAEKLDAHAQIGRDFFPAQAFFERQVAQVLPEVSVADLRKAWADIIQRAKLHAHHQITHEPLSVREHMTLILKQLSGRRYLEFTELFTGGSGLEQRVAVLVVHFLALLELARESLLIITQVEPYAPIYVRLSNQTYDA